MNILQLNNVSKRYGKKTILNDISMSIEEGEILGFIGPNGSGKTTTIRLITNLIYPNQGDIRICGHSLEYERNQALSYVSAIVENPGLYYFMSGKENMDIIRRLNRISIEKMNSIIEMIGLSDRINDKVKKYSLGMKQRLALGICLLTEPKLLVLDEPTNGLDPSGTLVLRSILKKLASETKMSVFISSHILSEIELICDRFIFIKEGKIVATKNNKRFENEACYKLLIEDSNKAESIFKSCDYIYEYHIVRNEIYITIDKKRLNECLLTLMQNDIKFDGIEIMSSILEADYQKIFMEE